MSVKEDHKDLGNTKISSQMVFADQVLANSNYTFTRLTPQSGSQIVPLSSNATGESLIEIPTVAHNLAESYLSFGWYLLNPGPGLRTWVATDVPPIQQIQLYTRNGQFLCDVNYLINYLKVVPKRELHISKFLNQDDINVLRRCNDFPGSGLNGSRRHDNSLVNLAYTEPRYLQLGLDNAGAGGNNTLWPQSFSAQANGIGAGNPAANVVAGAADPATYGVVSQQVKFPLYLLSNTIFAINKTLKFADVIVMRIVWSPTNRVAWTSTSSTDPTAGATGFAVGGQINNLALHLAVETQADVSSSLSSKIAAGFSLTIPYVYSYKINAGGTTAGFSVTTRWNRGHGFELRKLYTAVFNNAESGNTTLDHSNVNGSKVLSYYSMLDSNRIQQINIDCKTAYEDYMFNKKFLQETALQNCNVYQYNWFHLDDYTSDSKVSTELAGIPLTDREIRHDFIALQTANAAFNIYSFGVCDKKLTITAQGVMVQ